MDRNPRRRGSALRQTDAGPSSPNIRPPTAKRGRGRSSTIRGQSSSVSRSIVVSGGNIRTTVVVSSTSSTTNNPIVRARTQMGSNASIRRREEITLRESDSESISDLSIDDVDSFDATDESEVESLDSSDVDEMEMRRQMTDSDPDEDETLDFNNLTRDAAERGVLDDSEDDSEFESGLENQDRTGITDSDEDPADVVRHIEEQSDSDEAAANPLDESVASDVIRSQEHGSCTICLEDNPYDPVACLHCVQTIGCRRCAKYWWSSGDATNEADNHHQCPLCRAPWEMGPEVDSVFILRD